MPNNNLNGGAQWSEDQCAELTNLLASGMVYRLIAVTLNEKFGTSHTKNAIVGKVQRLGLVPPEKPKAAPYVRKPKTKSSPRPRIFREVMRIVPANTHGGMRIVRAVETDQPELRCVEIECVTSFDEVTGCRYPVGDGPFLFCNGGQMEGSSYCLSHFHLCRQESRPLTDKRYSRAAA